jgi:tetratricopeptide (TPR) repeat protein
MTSSRSEIKKERTLAKAVIPLMTLGLLAVFWRYNLKWMTLPVIAFLIFYYAILPKIVRSQVEKFHRKAIMLLTTGKAKEVPELVKQSIWLQLFAPSGSIDAKLGLAYVQCDAYDLALACFENAIPSAPTAEQPALQTGLVKALLVTGDLARAEAEGRAILDKVTRLPEVLALVARARVGLGKIDDETNKLLDEAAELSRTDDISLMISLTKIEIAIATGRKSGALPEGADSKQLFLRAWIHLVRGLLRYKKGDEDKAKTSFEKATRLLPSSFVSAVADKYFNKIENTESHEEVATPGRIPAVRRKRKRRR